MPLKIGCTLSAAVKSHAEELHLKTLPIIQNERSLINLVGTGILKTAYS
jgi:hypothetical protein